MKRVKNKHKIGFIISLIISILFHLFMGIITFLLYIWGVSNSLLILLAILFAPLTFFSFAFSGDNILVWLIELGYWLSLFLTISFFKKYKKSKSMEVVENEN